MSDGFLGSYYRQDYHPSDSSRTQTAQANHVRVLTERALKAGRPKVVDLENSAILEKLQAARVLGCGERLGAFYARTGLSAAQIMRMSSSQIVEFCDNAAKRDEEVPPITFLERVAEPQKKIAMFFP